MEGLEAFHGGAHSRPSALVRMLFNVDDSRAAPNRLRIATRQFARKGEENLDRLPDFNLLSRLEIDPALGEIYGFAVLHVDYARGLG